jgi:ABC-type bacteriocin/lantibiotic exporter with double-glycine peptidase domain
VHYERKRIQSLNDIIFLYKEVKILDKFQYFKTRFLNNVDLYLHYNKKLCFYRILPRHFFEFFGLFFIVIFFIISYQNSKNLYQSFAELGLLVAMSYRFLPSINRISVSIIDIKSSVPFIKNLVLDKLLDRSQKILIKKNIDVNKIKFSNLSFRYNNDKKLILNNINFELEVNDKIGIYGPSGIGKTTILEIITNLFLPSQGKLLLNKKKAPFEELKKIK